MESNIGFRFDRKSCGLAFLFPTNMPKNEKPPALQVDIYYGIADNIARLHRLNGARASLAYEYKSACTVPDNRAVLGSTDGNMVEMEEVAACLVVL